MPCWGKRDIVADTEGQAMRSRVLAIHERVRVDALDHDEPELAIGKERRRLR
jgi:hypothetical protein